VDGSFWRNSADRHAAAIQYALTYPERAASNEVALDWTRLRRLDLKGVHAAISLFAPGAKRAKKGAYPCAFNAATKSLSKHSRSPASFPGIAEVIERVLARMTN